MGIGVLRRGGRVIGWDGCLFSNLFCFWLRNAEVWCSVGGEGTEGEGLPAICMCLMELSLGGLVKVW